MPCQYSPLKHTQKCQLFSFSKCPSLKIKIHTRRIHSCMYTGMPIAYAHIGRSAMLMSRNGMDRSTNYLRRCTIINFWSYIRRLNGRNETFHTMPRKSWRKWIFGWFYYCLRYGVAKARAIFSIRIARRSPHICQINWCSVTFFYLRLILLSIHKYMLLKVSYFNIYLNCLFTLLLHFS